VGCQYGANSTRYQGPIVLINNEADEAYQQAVNIDSYQGGVQAVSHLLGLGHRQIAYIGSVHRPHTNACRLAGYQAAFTAAGLGYSASLVATGGPETDLNRAEATLDGLLAAGATAVFCFNDMIAIGVLEACRKRGVRVPQDLSVVGFDDIETGRYVSPPLTTIRQPRFEMGQRAMEMVLRLLQKQNIRTQTLPGELVLRESTQAVG
jgi:LacI family transcriptional regulator/LacI family repressor for deo operon, udp, cdd, tsx, nupC, and nupG